MRGVTYIKFSDVVKPQDKRNIKLLSDVSYDVPFLCMRTDNGIELIDGINRYWSIHNNPPDTIPAVFVTGDPCDDIVALRQLNKNRFKYVRAVEELNTIRYGFFINCETGINVNRDNIKHSFNFDIADVQGLAISMLNVGYFNPIIIYPYNDNFICVDGNKRLTAMDLMFKTHSGFPCFNVPAEIPVVIADEPQLKYKSHCRLVKPGFYFDMFDGGWE